MSELNLDRHDVSINEIEPDLCEQCELDPMTHYVSLDLRALGQEVIIGKYCEDCAQRVTNGLKAHLPNTRQPAREEG